MNACHVCKERQEKLEEKYRTSLEYMDESQFEVAWRYEEKIIEVRATFSQESDATIAIIYDTKLFVFETEIGNLNVPAWIRNTANEIKETRTPDEEIVIIWIKATDCSSCTLVQSINTLKFIADNCVAKETEDATKIYSEKIKNCPYGYMPIDNIQCIDF